MVSCEDAGRAICLAIIMDTLVHDHVRELVGAAPHATAQQTESQRNWQGIATELARTGIREEDHINYSAIDVMP